MVESAAVRDISEASVYPGMSRPVFHMKLADPLHRVCYPEIVHQNCVLRILCYSFTRCVYSSDGCLWTINHRFSSVVRVRSREGRRNRAPPPRIRWKDGKKVNPAVAAAEDAKAAAGTAGKA